MLASAGSIKLVSAPHLSAVYSLSSFVNFYTRLISWPKRGKYEINMQSFQKIFSVQCGIDLCNSGAKRHKDGVLLTKA